MTLQVKRKESTLEAKFVASCRRYGGDAIKLTSPGRAGMPDRLVVWNNGLTTFAELKRDGDAPVSKGQLDEIKKLQDKGHVAMLVCSELDIAVFIAESMKRCLTT